MLSGSIKALTASVLMHESGEIPDYVFYLFYLLLTELSDDNKLLILEDVLDMTGKCMESKNLLACLLVLNGLLVQKNSSKNFIKFQSNTFEQIWHSHLVVRDMAQSYDPATYLQC